MLLDDALADHEAEPGTADLARRARVDLLELAEQLGQVLRRDAVAVVADAPRADRLPCAVRRDLDARRRPART